MNLRRSVSQSNNHFICKPCMKGILCKKCIKVFSNSSPSSGSTKTLSIHLTTQLKSHKPLFTTRNYISRDSVKNAAKGYNVRFMFAQVPHLNHLIMLGTDAVMEGNI